MSRHDRDTPVVSAHGRERAEVDVIAHRCFADQYPENTVTGLRRSLEYVDAVEIDVRRCGSGELVVFHDETLDRLTDRSGQIDDTPVSVLKSLTVGNSPATIPTLGQFLDAIPTGTTVNVELKETGIAAAVWEYCRSTDAEFIFSSFLPDALVEMRTVAPRGNLAVLCAAGPSRCLSLASELSAGAVHPMLELATRTDIVHRAQAAGYDVNVWTVKTASEAETAMELGVDGVITDRWDLFEPGRQ